MTARPVLLVVDGDRGVLPWLQDRVVLTSHDTITGRQRAVRLVA